jgi:transcriptional regulator with XRE-family HTH domain
METLEIFAINLKKIRKMKGLSQEKLGAEAEIDRTYIQLLEAKKANPSLKIIEKLATTLNVSISKLFQKK